MNQARKFNTKRVHCDERTYDARIHIKDYFGCEQIHYVHVQNCITCTSTWHLKSNKTILAGISMGVGRGGQEGAVVPSSSRHFRILTIKTCKIALKSGFCPLLESDNVVLTCLPPVGKLSADAHEVEQAIMTLMVSLPLRCYRQERLEPPEGVGCIFLQSFLELSIHPKNDTVIFSTNNSREK